MNTQELLTADYLDIVFDKRNKIYGGYELRRHYDRRVKKAAIFALTGVAAFLSFSFITANRPVRNHVQPRYVATIIAELVKPLQPPLPKPKIIPPQPPPAQHRTIHATVPVIAPDKTVMPDKVPENNTLINTDPGPANNSRDSSGITTIPAGNSGAVNGIVNVKTGPPARWVEQMPEFIGDMYKYINDNVQYPEAARSNNIEGTVSIEFIVNEDGSVTNAHIVKSVGGGCDEEALRIVRNMPKWKPGKQNGKAVKVFFTLPIRFELN